MKAGCYTALITPFADGRIDYPGLEKLVEFQIANGVAGLLSVGTTGESPTLTWQEHIRAIEFTAGVINQRCLCIAGTGSNNTRETLEGTGHAVEAGVDAALLVDPYYNGPSSLEIRREYIEPVAAAFTEIDIIPYVIPGRTGAQLLPEDLALAYRQYRNVGTVKEATGNLDNMKRTRACCGPDYTILSGDDGLTLAMMTDPQIQAAGVISVASNVAPGPISEMVALLLQGEHDAAAKWAEKLAPLFDLITVTTTEQTPYGPVSCRARNPLAFKTLMALLGMPSGPCRKPIGKMTPNGINTVLAAARRVQTNNPEIFAPVERFFGVDIAARLEKPTNLDEMVYESY